MAYPFSDLLNPIKTAFSGMVSPAFPTKPAPIVPTMTPQATTTPAGIPHTPIPKPVIPNTSAPVPPTSAIPATGGQHTVASGDTLSAIALKNGMSLTQILNLNPQFRANPNLIKPGQTIALSGTPTTPTFNTQPKPNVAPANGTITTPSGVTVNPATGGVINQPTNPIVPIMPETPPTPPTPPAPNPLFTNPEYEAASEEYQKAIPLTPEEIANQEAINNLDASIRTGITGEAERPIPLQFITGRQKAIEQRGLNLEVPLQAKAALMQAKRQASLEASKFKLEQASGKLGALREASKPVLVPMGSSLVNQLTGKTVASGGSYTDKQAYDTFFNLAQTYPDANIQWNDALTAQQNLQTAQKAAQNSPSFTAKNTYYSTNPLTGQPWGINKLRPGGDGTPPPPDGNVTLDNLAPELKSTLNSAAGVQFFDASKINPAQLPSLQRASQQFGIPLLSKDDATAIQTDAQKYNTAQSLMDSILKLTPKVIKADNNQYSMTTQAARLKAIQIAPTLSTDNDTKSLLSTLEAFTSLLTRAAGEKGVLTDTDVRRIKNALPSITDNKELALQKAKQLNDVFRSSLEGSIKTYIGGVTEGGGTGANKGGKTISPDIMAKIKADHPNLTEEQILQQFNSQ